MVLRVTGPKSGRKSSESICKQEPESAVHVGFLSLYHLPILAEVADYVCQNFEKAGALSFSRN